MSKSQQWWSVEPLPLVRTVLLICLNGGGLSWQLPCHQAGSSARQPYPPANVLRVVLLPEETVDLVGKFIYQITIQDISGEIEIPDQGIIRIANNINKSFPH